MWVIMGLSREMLILNMWVEVEDSVEDRVAHDYQETLLVDLPLQGEGVLIKEVIRVPISQPWWEGLEKVTEQEGQEEVWGWRSICQSSRMKRPKMLLTYHSWRWDIAIFSLLGLGWPTLAAIHLPVITGVPWRPCQEFRWGCYPNQCLTECWISTMAWWWHLTPLVRSSIPSSKVLGRMWPSSEWTCHSRFRYSSQSTHGGRIQQEHVEEIKWDHVSTRAWTPNISACWPTKWMANTPLATPDLLLAAQKLERWAEARDPLLPKTTTTGGSNVNQSQTSGNLFPSRKLKGNHTFTAPSHYSGKHWSWRRLECKARRGRRRLSLWLKRMQKPWVESEEQISQ